ncbi:LysM peptidoglycan-binding domain-containing protein [Rhodanobacter aciditrophus]|uniref:LysM peptidoglycan-binding domain-containing protein n=1 Tax=Rhodanobacter aciditrophus TaxID=1623218 RepID=UPI003CEF941A
MTFAYRSLRIVLPLALAGVAGCAQMTTLKNKVDDRLSGSPRVTVERAAPETEAPATAPPSLRAIVSDDLQRGRYTEGERALRQYLAVHPGDRTAQALLHQLTVDPARELGTRSRSYTVRPGDSYSILAARYLGDAQRFLILARYNDSSDPSMLRAGQTLRLPLAAGSPGAETSPVATEADRAAPAASAAPGAGASGESTVAKARRLQRESLSLLAQGHKDRALVQLDEALSLDPRLKPSNPQAAAMRQQLLSAYHQRAIVLYRDQKLDPAIALWDHVLAIDPSYEPAVVYRARALELKQRLKQF